MSRTALYALLASVAVMLIGVNFHPWFAFVGVGGVMGSVSVDHIIARRRPPPTVPVNVRVERGTETIPLELYYVGLDPEGYHRWRATTPLHIDMADPWTLKADELPPRTRIIVAEANP